MTYGHAPTLTALKALPKEPDQWHDLLQPYRERYADIAEVVAATHPRDMLLALYNLCWALLKGDARPGTWEDRMEHYELCADAYHELERSAQRSLAVA